MPIPPFQPRQIIPVPAPTAPSAGRSADAASTARPASAGLDLDDAGLAEPAVVALPHDRDDDVVHADARVGGDGRRDRAVVHAPDGHRRGQVDGRLEHPPLGDLERARQLARAVQDGRTPAGSGSPTSVAGSPGTTAVTPRAGDPAARGRLGLVAPDRDVADAHAGHVGDRVPCGPAS